MLFNAHKTAKHKKTCMCHFDPLRRSRKFKFSTVTYLMGLNFIGTIYLLAGNVLNYEYRNDFALNNLRAKSKP